MPLVQHLEHVAAPIKHGQTLHRDPLLIFLRGPLIGRFENPLDAEAGSLTFGEGDGHDEGFGALADGFEAAHGGGGRDGFAEDWERGRVGLAVALGKTPRVPMGDVSEETGGGVNESRSEMDQRSEAKEKS